MITNTTTKSTFVNSRPTTQSYGKRLADLKSERATLRFHLKRVEEEIAWMEMGHE